jgi:hypothetical protein
MRLTHILALLAICCFGVSTIHHGHRGGSAMEPVSQSASLPTAAVTPVRGAPTPLPLAAVQAPLPDGLPRWEIRAYVTVALALLPTVSLLIILGIIIRVRRKRAS